jgi:hypothetical protein
MSRCRFRETTQVVRIMKMSNFRQAGGGDIKDNPGFTSPLVAVRPCLEPVGIRRVDLPGESAGYDG